MSKGFNAHQWNTKMCVENGCFTGSEEVSVSYDNIGWTAGGGFSAYTNATPWYQVMHVKNYLENANLPENYFNQ